MAGRVIYLDADDEITSAASRIRDVQGGRVALVLPYGSRVATSRINFRLLARDARSNDKRLSIIAGDAATRALAASAGLPIFGTVAEYESSLEGADGAGDAEAEGESVAALADAVAADPAAEPPPVGDEPLNAVADAVEGTLVSETVATPRHSRPRERASRGADETAALAGLAATTAAAAAARSAPRAPAGIPGAGGGGDPRAEPPRGRERPSASARARPASRSVGAGIGRTPVLIGAAVLGLALVVVGVGAFLFLPTATAVITPRTETIGPISLRIVADPTATKPDAEQAIVPAERIAIPLEAADSFPATGKRIEEARASGRVTFQSFNPVSPNTIPKGSIVSTEGGIRYRTVKSITIAAAELIFGTPVEVRPASASVDVTAVDPGIEGNVPENAIRVIRDEDPTLTKVRNPDPTTGGTHEEFPRIRQEDVDAAIADLRTRLTTAFDDRLDDPDLPGDTGTVFPETKTLGEPQFSVDTAKLVGQEVEAFELGATSEGTVVAVDIEPVQQVAEATIASNVEPGFELIAGSSLVEDAPAQISGGVITFPVVVTARQVLLLDPAAIKAEIIGKPLSEARAILATYGEADLSVWPDWVGTIPTLDTRVAVSTTEPVESTARPSPEPSP